MVALKGLSKEQGQLIFPSGKSADDLYWAAVDSARTRDLPLWQVLGEVPAANGLSMGWDAALVWLGEERLIQVEIQANGFPPLIHSLGLQLSQTFFLDNASRPVRTSDPLDANQASRFGLKPLVAVSLSVDGVSLHGIQFVAADKAVDIAPALATLWRSCPPLLGVPDVIKVSQRLADVAEALPAIFANPSPEIRVVSGIDRRHTANIKAAQSPNFSDGERKPPRSLVWLNETLLAPYVHLHQKAKRILYNTLGKRPKVPFKQGNQSLLIELASIYPGAPVDIIYTSATRTEDAFTGLPFYKLESPKITGFQSELVYDDWIRGMLESLPMTPGALANIIGCERREMELYLDRKAPINTNAFWRLSELLGLSFEEAFPDEPPYPQWFGPLLLTPKSRPGFINAYLAVTRGGDQDRAFEMIPNGPDSQYRYVVVEAYFELCIFRLQREWPACRAIDEGELINFDGAWVVELDIFQEIESLSGRVIAQPQRYRELLQDFVRPLMEPLADPDSPLEECVTDDWCAPSYLDQ